MLAAEVSKVLEQAQTHVVVFCASRTLESLVACNMVVFLTSSLERSPEADR